MASGHLGERLWRLRSERKLTQEQLAERADVSIDVIRKVEQRRRAGVRSDTLQKLADGLGVQPAALIGGDPTPLPETALTAGTDSRVDPDEEERLLAAARRPSRLDQRVVQSLSIILAEQRSTEDVIGSAPLITPVHGQLTQLEDMVVEARASVRPSLLDIAAQWAQFAAWLAISTQRWDDAARYLDHAAEWSTEIDAVNLGANVLSFKGYRAFLLGKVGPAIGLTQAARRDDRVYVGQRAYDALEEARAHAVTGDGRLAIAVLDEADDLLAAANQVNGCTPPWMYYHTPPFRLMKRGSVHRYLGRDHPAHNEFAVVDLTAGLDALGDNRKSEWAADFIYHLAMAYMQAGAADLASGAGIEAASIAREYGSSRLLTLVRRLHHHLVRRWPSDPTAAGLGDLLREVRMDMQVRSR